MDLLGKKLMSLKPCDYRFPIFRMNWLHSAMNYGDTIKVKKGMHVTTWMDGWMAKEVE